MAEYVTQYKFAQMCGISKQAVANGVRDQRVHKTKSGIDPSSPVNIYFRECAIARKAHLTARHKKPGVKKVKVKVSAPPEKPPEKTPKKTERPPAVEGGKSAEFDMFQKLYEETRLKKIQADTAVLKYAEKVGAMVDNESLRRKMGTFIDFLLTQLVYMPEDISDMIWMQAKDEADPERVIRNLLSERIGEIVKKAKVAAAKLEPPDTGVKYVMIGMDDADSDA